MTSPLALSGTDVTKSYSGIRVLDAFELSIANGEVHALLGENGSGKSTFIKILAGVVSPDAGPAQIQLGDQRLTFGSPASSFALGCRFVHQDLGLVEDLSVLDNMQLVAGFETRFGSITRANRASVQADLERVGLDVDPRAIVRDLSPATRTGVAVARAMHRSPGTEPRVLVLDEPTATLPDDEVNRLMSVIRGAQRSGIGILYVTHRLDEVFELADRVTILRDGKRITTQPVATLEKADVIRLMAGDELTTELAESAKQQPMSGDTRLVVSGLRGASVADASFSVRSGEIVGVAGITGSGRETLLSLLFGGRPRTAGTVSVAGRVVPAGRPDLAVTAGLGYLPPDRKTTGGFLDLSVSDNATIVNLAEFSSPWRIRRGAERELARDWTGRMNVRPERALALPLSSLSGGNQQKVLFAKWLRLGLRVFLVDEPTQGVDVNAKALLHRQLTAAAEAGLATVVASTDVDELAALCHRVLIFRRGRIAAELSGDRLTTRAITQACLESDTEVPA